MVEAAGIPFIPLLPEADVEVGQFFAKHPEVHEKEPLERTRFGLENYFLPQLPAQAAGLEMPLHDFPADVILTESMFYGTLPLFLAGVTIARLLFMRASSCSTSSVGKPCRPYREHQRKSWKKHTVSGSG